MQSTGGRAMVTLNVGGKQFTTSRATLALLENSLLGSMLSDRWSDVLARDENNNLFLDEDPVAFNEVLTILRTTCEHTLLPRYSPDRPSASLMAFVDKYLLRDILFPILFDSGTVEMGGEEFYTGQVSCERHGRVLVMRCHQLSQLQIESRRQHLRESLTLLSAPSQQLQLGHPGTPIPLNVSKRVPRIDFAMADPPLASQAGENSTWYVTLSHLGDGALLGVASSADDVHGILLRGKLLPWSIDDRTKQQLPTSDKPYVYPVIGRGVIQGNALEAYRFNVKGTLRDEVSLPGYNNVAALPAGDREACASCFRQGQTLRFSLSKAEGLEGMRVLTISTCVQEEEEQHRSMSLLLPEPPSHAPLRFYAQLQPLDVISVRHGVDMLYPQQNVF